MSKQFFYLARLLNLQAYICFEKALIFSDHNTSSEKKLLIFFQVLVTLYEMLHLESKIEILHTK